MADKPGETRPGKLRTLVVYYLIKMVAEQFYIGLLKYRVVVIVYFEFHSDQN